MKITIRKHRTNTAAVTLASKPVNCGHTVFHGSCGNCQRRKAERLHQQEADCSRINHRY